MAVMLIGYARRSTDDQDDLSRFNAVMIRDFLAHSHRSVAELLTTGRGFREETATGVVRGQ